MRERAARGDPAAQYLLGARLLRGDGLPQDYAEAERWLRAAASEGVSGAQFCLGYMYDTGKGVKRDPSEAARLYCLAAEQGDREAQHNLALLTWHGDGVAKDRSAARRLMDRALADPDDFRGTVWEFCRWMVTWGLALLASFFVGKLVPKWALN